MVAAENAEWGGHMGEVNCTIHRVFSFHFLVTSTFTAYTGFPLNAPKTCFGGGNVPLGSVCPGVKSSFFTAKKFNGSANVEVQVW